jgi:2-dehydro-3-deoxyphosphogluconate aldolase/(4S)-4-hydroxy-2-oxoglutarate aldolase
MPTGGVSPTRESVFDWIKAGAACLGIGSKLISKDLVTKGDWGSLKKKVAECLEYIKEAREG